MMYWRSMSERRAWRRRRTAQRRRAKTMAFYAAIAPGIPFQEHWGMLALDRPNAPIKDFTEIGRACERAASGVWPDAR